MPAIGLAAQARKVSGLNLTTQKQVGDQVALNNTFSGRRRRAWLGPAAVAAVMFVGGLAGNVASNYIQESLRPYRLWVWLVCAAAGITAVVIAIRESHLTAGSHDSPRQDESSRKSMVMRGSVDRADAQTENRQQYMTNQYEPTLPASLKLVEALLDCDCMKSPASRDQVIDQLPADIRRKVNRFQNDRQGVMSIVNACAQFDGGLESLLQVTRFYEGDSRAWREVERVSRDLYNPPPQQQAALAAVTPQPATRRDDATAGAVAAVSPAATAGKKYDVFLSHNSQDKPAVERLAVRLEDEVGLKPFLDKWHLVPGEPWQEALEQALNESATCVVCLGPNGIGPWENEEMRSALDERVRDKTLRVIPVLLPAANLKDPQTLPRFMRRLTWVNFEAGVDNPEAFRRLVAGIRGQAPGRGGD